MIRSRPQLVSSGSDNRVTDDDLQAYVDGQLDSRRRAAVEAYLADRPDEAARLAAYRAQNIGLHALFDPLPGDAQDDEALPPRIAELAGALDTQLRRAESTPQTAAGRGTLHTARRLAASVAMLLAAGSAGWMVLDQMNEGGDSLVALTRQASLASQPSQRPLQQAAAPATAGGVSAEQEQRQVVAWLAALPGDVPTTVPDLEDLGFDLVGEHLLPNAGGAPMAQLFYQDGDGQRISLTMRSGGKPGQTSFTFTRDGNESRFVWQDAHMAYNLIGRMPQEKLLKIAEAISKSLRDEAPATPTQEAAESPGAAEAGSDTPAGAAEAPADPAAPANGTAPLLDKSPLIPVPLPEADAPKET